ncbi:MAG: methylenetetrahydrofolate reductase [Candidatus Lokiarchaeota archaeon]|nr:methylenetetrahydrofolate reductase [Candidatus Lokiarchaeota archaeon]
MTEVKTYSNLMKEIQSGRFVLTGELEPERTANIEPTVNEAIELRKYCIAANITDNPKSTVCLSSLAGSYLTQEKSGLEIVYQLTCRDQNRMGLGAAILGAASLGLKNILALTGDHNACGDMPASKPVFDYDSTHLIQLVREMADKRSIEGLPLDEDCPNIEIHVGGAANPNASPMEPEIMHIQRKAMAGVEFLQTQVVYDIEIAEPFLKEIREKTGVPVLLGIFPMSGYGVAKGFDELVPGVSVPKDLLAKFKAVKKGGLGKKEKKEAYRKLNVDFYVPMLKELKKKNLVAGCHIMAVHYPKIFPPLMEALDLQPRE